MAEQDKDQRTEEATPRRKEKLREEGKIAKSADLGGATVVAGVLMTLTWVAPKCARDITAFSARLFALRDHRDPLVAVQGVHQIFSAVCLPTVSVAAVVALATGVAQTRGLFRPELALPKAERLNPLPQLKRIIPGKESALEIIKQLFKILALAAVAYAVLKDRVLSFSRLASLPPTVAALDVGRAAAELLLYGVLAFVAVAAFDYWLAWRRFREESKMSHQETRDERRQDEGDPHVRQRLRQKMRELAGRRAVADVRQATVLVTNPTHVSVALRYDPERDGAPMVLAKGIDQQALQMRQAARAAGVPIVENRPFARALYKEAKVGEAIADQFFSAAAEIIAHVMRLKAGGA